MSDINNLLIQEKVNQCPVYYVLALKDTMNAISGKWKLPIIASLLRGMCRFKDLQSNIGNLTSRMLSKELKELELNGIVERKVYNQTPVLIEYHLTESGKNLITILDSMIDWGILHRHESLTKMLPG